MLSVAEAGVYDLTQRVDYDEDTMQRAVRKLHDIGRARQHRPPGSESLQRPFLMAVNFAHPRDPYIITKKYWDRYKDDDIDMPRVRLDVDEDPDGAFEPNRHTQEKAAGGRGVKRTPPRLTVVLASRCAIPVRGDALLVILSRGRALEAPAGADPVSSL